MYCLSTFTLVSTHLSNLFQDASRTEALDSKGISGWDRVDALAKVLMSLRGLSVSNADAQNIIQLYNNLDDYHKRPLVYKSIVKRPATGRFGCKKKRSGHIGVVAMKRCFLSAVAPLLPPSRNRLVEAIFIRLCNAFTNSRTETRVDGRKTFISRWKQLVSAYNNIKACLFNCQALLSNTGITLFNVNETSVSLWFQNKTRREEIVTLIQGLPLPGRLILAKETLPLLRETPSDLQGDLECMLFQNLTIGQDLLL